MCHCLSCFQKKAGEYEEPYRFSQDHEMFERLAHILTSSKSRRLYSQTCL